MPQVKLLLDAKARVNKACTGFRRSALHYAAIGCGSGATLGEGCGKYTEVLALLLAAKAQVSGDALQMIDLSPRRIQS